MSAAPKVLRPPAEVHYAAELAALAKADKDPRPPGWKLSPKAVRSFICGGKSPKIERKFYGDDVLVERAIVGLAGNRGLLLVGEPGTAKSMLSELLAAAISGCSTNTIQGSSGTTEDQIKYSWNYALLLAEGPSPRALVAGPLHVGMSAGLIVRFEEVTRCPPEIQDVLISIISEKLMMVPELSGDDRVLLVREVTDGKWTLPGGWADVNDSPSLAVEKEIEQESGFTAKAVKLAALYDRNLHDHPAYLFHAWKAFFICDITGGEARTSHETDGVEFFPLDALPELSTGRSTEKQIRRMYEHHLDRARATEFD